MKSYVLGIIEKMTFLDKSILVKTTKGDLSAWIHEGGSYYLKKASSFKSKVTVLTSLLHRWSTSALLIVNIKVWPL